MLYTIAQVAAPLLSRFMCVSLAQITCRVFVNFVRHAVLHKQTFRATVNRAKESSLRSIELFTVPYVFHSSRSTVDLTAVMPFCYNSALSLAGMWS